MTIAAGAFEVRPVAPGVHVITEAGYSHAYLTPIRGSSLP